MKKLSKEIADITQFAMRIGLIKPPKPYPVRFDRRDTKVYPSSDYLPFDDIVHLLDPKYILILDKVVSRHNE